MKYMGSKARLAKQLIPIILADRKDGQAYVEPFCGGCNMIDKVDGRRVAGDANVHLVEFWKAFQSGEFEPLEYYSKKEYQYVKANTDENKPLTGYVGICCSYSGKWFGGYAGVVQTAQGERNYPLEAYRNVMKQRDGIKGVEFHAVGYDKLPIPGNSIIYCDPPYRGTTGYKIDFHHDKFFDWCRAKAKDGYTVFVSEYNAPGDFKCVWERGVKSSLSANGWSGSSKKSVERLFTI